MSIYYTALVIPDCMILIFMLAVITFYRNTPLHCCGVSHYLFALLSSSHGRFNFMNQVHERATRKSKFN